MTHVVLDVSAILALLKGERGASKVGSVIADASVCAINQAEVISHFVHLGVGACNRSGVCSQTAGFSAHALCHWQVASCSNYLPMCSPSSGAACKRGVVLTLPANGFSNRFYPDVHFQDAADHACLPSSVILY